jgi:hypothetical protein
MAKTARQIIAKAISEADSSYFFEDYDKQAAAVLSALAEAKLTIVPSELTEDHIKHALDNMPYGTVKPERLVVNVYNAVLNAFKSSK